jgi:hypothetical protein
MARPWVSWQEWQKTYGPRWKAFRRWYFDHPYTLKRCVWCLVRPRPVTALQLNHLTYRMADPSWPALWQVVPMCKRCHDWETWLTGLVFGEGRRRTHAGTAHYWVTLGVPALAWGLLAAIIAVAAMMMV